MRRENQQRRTLKKVAITTDFTVEIPDHVDPNEITFEIDLATVRVDHMSDGPIPGAKVLSYCTQEYFGEE